MKPLTSILLASPLLLSLAACGDSAEARELRDSVGDAYDATADYTAKQLRAFKDTMRTQWSALGADLERLKADIDKSTGPAQEKARELYEAAKREVAAAGEKLDAAGEAGDDALDTAVRKAKEAMTAAKQSMQEAWAALTK